MIQIDDAIIISNRSSPLYNKTGVIKNICRNCLFLWDTEFLDFSNGIFTEKCSNVTIKGSELLQEVKSKHMPALSNSNRIMKHPFIGKIVRIIAGELKG